MYGRLALSPYRQKALKDMFSGYIVYAVLRIGRQLPYSAFPLPSVRLLSLRLISKPLVAMVQASFISSAAHRPQQQFADYASCVTLGYATYAGEKRRTTTMIPRLATLLSCKLLENMKTTIN
jgi:hypothetical protein